MTRLKRNMLTLYVLFVVGVATIVAIIEGLVP